MKSLSLKMYARNYMYELSGDHSFQLVRFAADAETINHRMYAPLVVYAFLTDMDENRFSGRTLESLRWLREACPVGDDSDVVSFLLDCGDEELEKFALTFQGENARRDQNDLKNRYRQALKKLMNQKNLTQYRLCKYAAANPGNFHRFLNMNDNSALSLKKCEMAFQKAVEA